MTTQTHQEELKEFYDRLPEIYPNPANRDAKMINLDLLEAFTDKMMNKAYYYGKIEALNGVEDLVKRTFNQ